MAKSVRQVVERKIGHLELLDDGHWYEHDVRTDAHSWIARSATSYVPVDRSTRGRRILQLGVLEHVRFDWFTRAYHRRVVVPYQHRDHRPQRQGFTTRPVGCSQLGMDDNQPAEGT